MTKTHKLLEATIRVVVWASDVTWVLDEEALVALSDRLQANVEYAADQLLTDLRDLYRDRHPDLAFEVDAAGSPREVLEELYAR